MAPADDDNAPESFDPSDVVSDGERESVGAAMDLMRYPAPMLKAVAEVVALDVSSVIDALDAKEIARLAFEIAQSWPARWAGTERERMAALARVALAGMLARGDLEEANRSTAASQVINELATLRAEVGKLDTLWRALIVERDSEAERADAAEAALSAADVTIAALRGDGERLTAEHAREIDAARAEATKREDARWRGPYLARADELAAAWATIARLQSELAEARTAIKELADSYKIRGDAVDLLTATAASARAVGAQKEREAWCEVTGADNAQALAAELDIARAKRRTRGANDPHCACGADASAVLMSANGRTWACAACVRGEEQSK